MLHFGYLEKGLGIASPSHLCMIFWEQCFSCYILLTDQILLFLLLEILDNMCIAIICFSGRDANNFEINLFYMTKKSRKNFRYLENKKSFLIKNRFSSITFKGLSVVKNSQTWELPLRICRSNIWWIPDFQTGVENMGVEVITPIAKGSSIFDGTGVVQSIHGGSMWGLPRKGKISG